MDRPEPYKKKIILGPDDFEPSSEDMDVVGVFNPGVTTMYEDGSRKTVLMARVAELPSYKGEDVVRLPYFPVDNSEDSLFEIGTDDIPRDDVEVGKKEVTFPDGTTRLRHISYPRVVKLVENSSGEMVIDYKEEGEPEFYPQYEHERYGMEDFRITPNEEFYLLTYVSAHRDKEVSTSIAVTEDFENFERLPLGREPRPYFCGMKDVALFGERVPSPHTLEDGTRDWAALIRPNAFPSISKPGVWVSYSHGGFGEGDDHFLRHWGDQERLITSKNGEFSGTGAPLVRMNGKWVGSFHIVEGEGEDRMYKGCLMAVDAEEPWELSHRSDVLTEPNEFDVEEGFVPNVEYPIGIVEEDGVTDMYSGVDDTYIGLRRFYTEDLIKFLEESSYP